MKGYVVNTPKLVQRMYADRLWSIPSEDSVYLTFDDGPVEDVTPWVMQTLEKFSALATFFCIGNNIEQHPGIYSQLIAKGHAVGNHTFNHPNGKNTAKRLYLEELKACDQAMSTIEVPSKPVLFRPPYGRMKKSQANAITKMGYKIVMWDVLSADFDTTLSGEDCYNNVIKYLSPGSIVVFHDSKKAESRLRYCLPKVLEYISEKGWKCEKIAV